ncbi:hypothetical protein TrRE_jg11989 [Triparma retinervis]|uniref:DNA topoisomerase (ATP-hydrolyzing) n=1 Tax=Triparma retinervis TaxID=2557542 RepID=A0A9W7ASQ7_9STRA|nr:hypothetical protein TrRE_jg11989 [Triparma retinervis]
MPPKKKSKPKKVVNLAEDATEVLAKVRELRKKTAAKIDEEGKKENADDYGDFDPSTMLKVEDLDTGAVAEKIENIAQRIAKDVMEGRGYTFTVPSRASSNQHYVKSLDRIVLGGNKGTRTFSSVSEVRKTTITARCMQLIHNILGKGIHITKRDLFYTDVKLFVKQAESDGVLDDLSTMIGCTRSNLNVVASDKGLVVGRVQEDGDPIDCTRMGVGGKAIPPYTDKIDNIQSDAEFILLVEKDAVYMRLAEDRFYHRYPCIIITAKGQPDVATRMFLRRLKYELKIPVLGLFDSDPYGLKILSVYMSGSKNMSYDSAHLTTPDIKWLGIRPSDLDRYGLPEQCRLDMTDADISTGKIMIEEDFIKANPKWVKEMELMLKTKKKAEIQALSSFGFQYISEDYLPRKLREGDWI